jgi:carbon storage regulator CsrA
MLVFTRKSGEAVVVTGLPGNTRELKVSVIEIRGGRVRLGFEAESNIGINRSEIWDRKQGNGPIPKNNDSETYPRHEPRT